MALSSKHQALTAKVNRKMNEHCSKQHQRYDKRRGIDQHK